MDTEFEAADALAPYVGQRLRSRRDQISRLLDTTNGKQGHE
ncbi:hypothetical protein [Amycolatopsis sp. cmx-11-51]